MDSNHAAYRGGLDGPPLMGEDIPVVYVCAGTDMCGSRGAAHFHQERHMALKEHEAGTTLPGTTGPMTGARLI
jgi:hypothetical protein